MGMEIVFGLRLGFQIPMYTQLRISVGIAIQAQNFPSRDMGDKGFIALFSAADFTSGEDFPTGL